MNEFLRLAEQMVKDQEKTQGQILKAFQPLIDSFKKPSPIHTQFIKPLAEFIKANNFVVEPSRQYHVTTKRLKIRKP